MTFSKSRGDLGPNPTEPHCETILRSPAPALYDVEQAIEADRRWFDEHPDEDQYIREFCSGEFGKMELPVIPPGFRYATMVSVIHRDETGVADRRHRHLLAVCEDVKEASLFEIG
jgi:hypothetical protein